MPLTSGTRLGHYEILAPIGAGGMGEVYRARDTKLNREVAVKLLPEPFAADPDRMARFAREAQVLASLNHPNIAAIYGVEDRALVMELVDGPMLSERIAQGPWPVEEATPIIEQLIDALEYAHEKGVVHRDLKPANIKITSDERVKVLDFGLAKALGAETAAADPASSPTLTMRATMAGMIMGTAGYMSPEQARGQSVDKRADIWAFGVVLYEMLTGRQLFGGPTVSDTLAAVLKEEPHWDLVPEQMRRLVRTCLVKDARRRMRDIGDARLLMNEAPAAVAAAAPAPVPRRRGTWTLTGLALIFAGLMLAVFRAPHVVPQPPLSLSVDLGPDAVTGRDTTIAISPDGTRIVYPVRTSGGKLVLAVRHLSEPGVTPLGGTEAAINPFFSPDGEWVGFFADEKLKKISIHGGPAIPLAATSSGGGRGGSWAEDGSIIAALGSQAGLSRIPAAGTTPEILTKLSDGDQRTHRYPQVLPDGKALLFTANSTVSNFDDANVDVLSLTKGQRKTVQRGGYFGRYLPSGHLVYLRGNTLFAVPFNLEKLDPAGTPVPVMDGIAANVDFGGGQLDCSRNGTLVFLAGKSAATRERPLLWMDATGKTEQLTVPMQYQAFRLSPDGRRVALFATVPKPDLWVYDTERRNSLQLTFNGGLGGSGAPRIPVWTPDGKHIAYYSDKTIRWIRADGAGEPQILLRSDGTVSPYSFSPDGKYLAYYYATMQLSDLWILPLDLSDSEHPKAGKAEPFLQTPVSEISPNFSPDGQWIAYSASESGSSDIFVRPFAPGKASAGKWKISNHGGRFPVWSRTGHQLLYSSPEGDFMVMDYKVAGNSFEPGVLRPWAQQQKPDPGRGNPVFDISPDGKHLLIPGDAAPEQPKSGNLHATFVVNWFDELRRRVPVNK